MACKRSLGKLIGVQLHAVPDQRSSSQALALGRGVQRPAHPVTDVVADGRQTLKLKAAWQLHLGAPFRSMPLACQYLRRAAVRASRRHSPQSALRRRPTVRHFRHVTVHGPGPRPSSKPGSWSCTGRLTPDTSTPFERRSAVRATRPPTHGARGTPRARRVPAVRAR